MVALINVPVILDDPLPVVPPVIPPVTDGADHAYVVPAGTIPLVPFTGVNVNNTPVQLTVVIAVILAFAFTVTVNVNDEPVQLPLNGVTV